MDWDVEMDDAAPAEELLGQSPTTAATLLLDPDPPDASTARRPSSPRGKDEDADGTTLIPSKVYVQGLDILSTDDVKSYAKEHFGTVEKVEWIDDTSANLIFRTESSAQAALVAMSAVEISDPTQLPILECLPAKPLSSKPDVRLYIRFAVAADRKQAGAASRSRFYLLHPEYDPEERRRRERGGKSRYRDRDSGSGRYPRGDGGRGWKLDEHPVEFDESFYDDDEEALAARAGHEHRRRSHSAHDFGDQPPAIEARDARRELFPGRRDNDRDRRRSASPLRDRDGDDLMHEGGQGQVRRRRGSRPSVANNSSKELFPSKKAPTGTSQLDQPENDIIPTRVEDTPDPAPGQASIQIKGIARGRGPDLGISIKGIAASARELFPDKFDSNSGKELFADKLEGRGRRRQKAEDLFH